MLGQAFAAATEAVGAQAWHDLFDTTVIQILKVGASSSRSKGAPHGRCGSAHAGALLAADRLRPQHAVLKYCACLAFCELPCATLLEVCKV
jgi:hypothetical protein